MTDSPAPNTESLLEKSASTDIVLLLRAKEEAKRRVKDDPSHANLAAFEKASRLLDEASGKAGGNKSFPDVRAILSYLQAAGRKVSQSQIYKDLKRGHLRRQPDKSFRQRDVDAYAQTLAIVSMPEAKTDGVIDLAEEKLKEEVGKLREQRQSIAFDREIKAGKFIRREEVALELASRAAALSLSLRSVFRLNVADWMRLAGGDAEKAEWLAQEYENSLDLALNEFSKPMEFSAEFIGVDDENASTMPESEN